MFDVNKQVYPEICDGFPSHIVDKIYQYYPRIKYGDVFLWNGDRLMISDAWSKHWGYDEVKKLLGFAVRGAVVKVSCAFDVLLRSLDATDYKELIILNFGRPATEELFITSRRMSKSDDYVYLITPSTHRQVLTKIKRFKLNSLLSYCRSLCSGGSIPVADVGRPFIIENWMWPLVALPAYSRYTLGSKKMLSFMEFGSLIDNKTFMKYDISSFQKSLLNSDYKKHDGDWSSFNFDPRVAGLFYRELDDVV